MDQPPEADLARLLLHATSAAEREMIARLERVGLDMLGPRHLPVLRTLNPRQGSRATEMAREAGLTRQAIGLVVAELEQLGIVEQTPDPSDARAKLVRYTPSGLRGYRRAMSIFTELEREAAELLGPRRLAALKRDLATLASVGRAANS